MWPTGTVTRVTRAYPGIHSHKPIKSMQTYTLPFLQMEKCNSGQMERVARETEDEALVIGIYRRPK